MLSADLCPEIDLEQLASDLILEYCEDYQYLFYRSVDEFDGYTQSHSVYQCYCSACKQHFTLGKSRKLKITELFKCPKCQSKISVKKYIEDRGYRSSLDLKYLFLYKHYVKGPNESVWVRVFKCEYSFIGSPGD